MKKICIILTLIILTTFAFAIDNSGANAPEVYQGLYPIKYDGGGNVVFTNASDPEWYNYTEGKWANAVTLDKLGQMNPSTATIDNITGYYVWIPRYAYLIRTGYGISDTGRIDIRFLSGTTNADADGKTYYTVADLDNTHEKWEEVNTVTYIGDRQMDYLVHPAFKFEEELRGIWVGKYEASKGTGIYADKINTIPSAVLWQSIDINNSFEETRDMSTKYDDYDENNLDGLGSNINTHLIKSTEYGAVAYLLNSIFGDNTETSSYRVYGLDSGKEYTAGGLAGATGIAGDKYVDTYTKDESGNVIDIKGSAYLETSDGTNAWGGTTTTMINDTNGVAVKNGAYGTVASNGQATDVGFRVVLTKGEKTENKVKKAYVKQYRRVNTDPYKNSYYWLMENGDVWVMGDNNYGQLGIEERKYLYVPEQITVDADGNKIEKIKEIIMSNDSLYYLGSTGSLYVSGENSYGQLGLGHTNDVKVLTKVNLQDNKKIAKMTVKDNSVWITDETGNIHVCGKNKYGRLGVASTGTIYSSEEYMDVGYVSTITRINNLSSVKEQIKSGDSIYYLTTSGEVYVCGNNQFRQLGVANIETMVDEYGEEYGCFVSLATKIDGLSSVKEIIIEDNSVYYLTTSGEVYVCGKNQYGQLGIPSTGSIYDYNSYDYINYVSIATKIDGLSSVKEIIRENNSVYYITTSGEVYVCGNDNYKRLGVEANSNVYDNYSGYTIDILTELTKLVNIPAVTKIVSTSNATFYLTEEGEVYVAGYNSYKALGVESTETYWDDWAYSEISLVSVPTKVNGLGAVENVISFNTNTYYLLKNGDVYACGYNTSGELGIESTETYWDDLYWEDVGIVSVPTKIDVLKNIKEILVSGNGRYYFDENGNVYVSGQNIYGQLGTGDVANVLNITKLDIPGGIRDVLINDYSARYISKNGEVYVAGKNTNGRLGTGTTSNVTSLTKLNIPSEVSEMIINDNSAWYLSKNGEVYANGKNTSGRLGVSGTSDILNVTKLNIPSEVKIHKIINGSSTYYLGTNGDVYVSGYNGSGQLGLGHKNSVTTVQKSDFLTSIDFTSTSDMVSNLGFISKDGNVYSMNLKNIELIDFKEMSSELKIKKIIDNYYITENGEVYVSGYNYYGQLGTGDTKTVYALTKIKIPGDAKIKDIFSSSSSVWYIDEEGSVYVSGNNEDGRLGTGDKNNVLNVSKINIPNNAQIKKIFFKTGYSPLSVWYLDEDGKVYVSGGNTNNFLGMGEEKYITNVTQIEELEGGIKEIVHNGSSVLYLDEDGNVYGSGSNTNGILGMGDDQTITRVTKLHIPENDKIERIIVSDCVWYIGTNGEIYVSGKNNNGKLGVGGTTNVKEITKLSIPGNIKIVEVVYYSSGTWYIGENGEVFVSGANSSGWLGTNDTAQKDTLTKINIPDSAKIKKVVPGDNCAWYIATNGDVYVSGKNKYGLLGLGDVEEVKKLTKVNMPDGGKVSDIFTYKGWGIDSVWYLGTNGEVYVSGKNSYGQLGLGHTNNIKTPTKVNIPDNKKIIEIHNLGSSYPVVFYVAEDKSVYVSGQNENGRLGVESTGFGANGSSISIVSSITKVDTIDNTKVKDMMFGDGYAKYLYDNGEVYVNGVNSSGSLAQGEGVSIVTTPTPVKELDNSYSTLGNITSIYGNSNSTIFEEDDGDIFVIGDNTNNKLGTAGNVDIATKINITGIKDAGIGSDFSVFLKDDGSIVGYGGTTKSGNGLKDIAQIAVGDNHAVFLTKSGEIINKGSTTSAHVAGIDNAYKIVAGANHTVVLKKNGTTKSFGQADSGLTNVVDVFAGKNMTVFLTRDGKVHLMEGNARTELAISNVVYAELNGEQPYFITYDRDLIDRDGNIIEALGAKMNWVKEVKGNVVLNERMRVYDLSKL